MNTMKFALEIVLLAVAINGISLSSLFEAENKIWEHFKETHSKTYNHNEDVIRRNMFLIKKKSVDEHNTQFINGQQSYRKELNKFSDWLPYETSTLNGFTMPQARRQSTYTFLAPDEDIEIPDAIDWRLKGAVTPVKDQGRCGSCWAFSTTGSLEGQHFRKTGKLVSLSEQNLMDCDKVDHSCGGGNMDNAFKFIKDNGGIDTEESYPYIGTNSYICNFNSSNIGATDKGFVNLPVGDEAGLEKAVATIGPISVGIDATDSLMNYHHGIFESQICQTGQLNHAVLVVGYGVSSEGTPYWIVKNSWGTDWGEDGYFRMIRGKNMCGISMFPSYPLV